MSELFQQDCPAVSINGGVFGQDVTGVQRYAREICKYLGASTIGNGWRPYRTIIARDTNFSGLDGLELIRTPALPRSLWAQAVLPFWVDGVLLSLGNIGPIVCRNQILCIHDANVFLAPQSYTSAFRIYYQTMLPLLGRVVRRVTTVSEFSASMLVRFSVAPASKISVIRNGHEHVRGWDATRSHFWCSALFERPFVFALGSRALHKNIAVLETIAPALDTLGIDLVVAGRRGSTFSGVPMTTSQRNVRYIGAVSDDDLAALFGQALCFAFPSKTEGFGLPALEAMALGCPVVAANTASLPEVCGDAVLYADPVDPKAWIDAIACFRRDAVLRSEYSAKAVQRAKLFKWSNSSNQYMELIESMQ